MQATVQPETEVKIGPLLGAILPQQPGLHSNDWSRFDQGGSGTFSCKKTPNPQLLRHSPRNLDQASKETVLWHDQIERSIGSKS